MGEEFTHIGLHRWMLLLIEFFVVGFEKGKSSIHKSSF